MDLRRSSIARLERRGFLAASVAGALSTLSQRVLAHNDAGVVSPPQPPPALSLTLHDEAATTLAAVLTGRVTALQLMFTSCQATCPIQGALFGSAVKKLGDDVKPAQLLSISIDPGQDSPAVLRAWLKRYSNSPRWKAARPAKQQLDALVDFLKSRSAAPDPHTAQVYYFNRKGALVLRSVDFPPAEEIVRTLRQIADKA